MYKLTIVTNWQTDKLSSFLSQAIFFLRFFFDNSQFRQINKWTISINWKIDNCDKLTNVQIDKWTNWQVFLISFLNIFMEFSFFWQFTIPTNWQVVLTYFSSFLSLWQIDNCDKSDKLQIDTMKKPVPEWIHSGLEWIYSGSEWIHSGSEWNHSG